MYKTIHGYRSLLTWVHHLIGTNVGCASLTITMIIAGLIDGGILTVIVKGGVATELKPNTEVIIIPISTFAAILVIGVLAGGLEFITNYLVVKNEETRSLLSGDYNYWTKIIN